jgi:hypothetical protein
VRCNLTQLSVNRKQYLPITWELFMWGDGLCWLQYGYNPSGLEFINSNYEHIASP